MEFIKTTLRKFEINVLFTGELYIFNNSYHGLVAVARRDYDKSTETKQYFYLEVGNSSCTGGSFCDSAVVEMAKRIINKHENRYSEQTLVYEIIYSDLNKKATRIEVI